MGNKIRAEANGTSGIFIESVTVADGIIKIIAREGIQVAVVFSERTAVTTHIVAEDPVS